MTKKLWVTHIQRFCIHDGPGIRTTVFLQGCPLRCRWCHNPECKTASRKIKFTANLCIGCGACVDICPTSCHQIVSGQHAFRRRKCNTCGKCALLCPTQALEVVGRQLAPEDIIGVVARDRDFYLESGGGLTISGGEPFAQPEGTDELLSLARKINIDTAVETCGYVDWFALERVLDDVGLWLYDLKSLDSTRHRAITGFSNRLVLDNLIKLLGAGARVILRIPVIPGLNDDAASILRFLDDTSILQKTCELHLLPYNRLAESKYQSLGLRYALKGLQPPSERWLEGVKSQLEKRGLNILIGG